MGDTHKKYWDEQAMKEPEAAEKEMIEVKTLDGLTGYIEADEFPKVPPARPLTRGEIKELRGMGMDPTKLTGETMADFMDWVLDTAYAGHDFDVTPYPDCLKLTKDTIDLTYGTAEQAKN